MDVSRLYTEYRPLLFSIAYRMLGVIQDAEDIVQDVFVTLQQQNPESIRNMKSYLAKIVTNRCINELKSSRKTKAGYIGPWLPEPIVKYDPNDPSVVAERHDDVAFAFLVLIQKLAPAERAVFVLRETLGCPFDEIAGLLDKTAVNCRKLYSRAKQKIAKERLYGDFIAQPYQPDQPGLAHLFREALLAGDIAMLTKLLSEDVIMLSDGGGKVRTAVNPIYGKQRVLALLSFTISRAFFKNSSPALYQINGHAGLLLSGDDGPSAVFAFAYTPDGSAISRVYVIRNPDKLR